MERREEKMSSTKINERFFCVSLPRTGTKSLCKMFGILGFNFKHNPGPNARHYIKNKSIHMFADTPIYSPSVFLELAKEPINKFIYINRPVNEWVESFEYVRLDKSYADYLSKPDDFYGEKGALDKKCLLEMFNNVTEYTTELARESYHRHRQAVMTLDSNRLLIYKFEQGWEPLCEFVGKPVPSEPIPKINSKTLYEPIV
jgi:hypothetical protein